MEDGSALATMSVSGEPFDGQPRLGLESFGDQATVNPQVLSHRVDRSCDTIGGHQQVRQTDCTPLELKRVRQAADCATTPAPAPLSSAPGPPRTSTGSPLPRMAESQVARQSPMILVFFDTMCAPQTYAKTPSSDEKYGNMIFIQSFCNHISKIYCSPIYRWVKNWIISISFTS